VFCPDSSLSVINLTEFDRWLEADSGRDCDIMLFTASFGSSPEDPQAHGLELLRRLRGKPVFPAVIALAEDGNELTAVRALQLGAVDYLPKRLLTPERLNTSVRLALRRIEKRVQRKLASLTHVTDVSPPPDDETTREQPKPYGAGISQSVVSLAVAATPTPTAEPTAAAPDGNHEADSGPRVDATPQGAVSTKADVSSHGDPAKKADASSHGDASTKRDASQRTYASPKVEAASADSTRADPTRAPAHSTSTDATPAAKAPDSAVQAGAKPPDSSIDDAEASSFEFSAQAASTQAPILDVNELIAQLKRSDESTPAKAEAGLRQVPGSAPALTPAPATAPTAASTSGMAFAPASAPATTPASTLASAPAAAQESTLASATASPSASAPAMPALASASTPTAAPAAASPSAPAPASSAAPTPTKYETNSAAAAEAASDGATQLMSPRSIAAALDAAAASAMAAGIKATESSIFGTTAVGATSKSKSAKSGSSKRPSTPSPAVTAEFIPGYIIKMKIGESEKAVVYLATSISLGSNVALKVSKTLRDDTAGRQFLEREYTAIIAIRDPLVVQIYDYGVHAGFEYLAMEYLLRGDLKARMQAGLKEGEALRYVEQIACALRVVHNSGLLHRDLKPPNVMLRENDDVALIDFGLARALDGSTPSTRTGVLRGSPYYMSPEQAQGEILDVRSDFYSLGIMFYEMLTGRKPYTGATAMEVLQQHVNSPLPPLPHSLSRYEDFLHKLVAKNRAERFAQAEEIIAAIGELRTAMTLNVESAVA
jgi:CheY-like chemotaxis protein